MKKFKLMLTRGLILTLLAVLTSTVLKAQSPTYSGGDGSEGSPFQISSISDWNTFAQAVTDGTDYSGKYFILTANITITVNNTASSDQMVGTWTDEDHYNAFSGTFNGNCKTITFNVGTEGIPYDSGTARKPIPRAPFCVIKGATINNLYVKGMIVPNRQYNAGLVGHAYDTNNINNCTSSINIDCSHVYNELESATDGKNKQYDCSAAGLVAEVKTGGKMSFVNCIFDGSIYKNTNTNANRGAGFVSYSNSSNNVSFTNCLMAGEIDLYSSFDASTLSTFSRPATKITYNIGNHYCESSYGNVPKTNCTRASMVKPDEVYKKYTVSGNNYYFPVTVSPELRDMEYNSTDPMPVTVSYYGKTLVEDTDYTIVIEKENSSDEYEEVSAITGPEGNYRVTITGVGNGFEGTKFYVFSLISEDKKWVKVRKLVKDAASGGTINLPNDFIGTASDTVIEINKNLTINLNGHKIDRNLVESQNYGQVLRIAAGCTVTINGPGTITGGYSRAVNDSDGQDSKNDAGGIYNMGNLTLNNVNVEYNRCKKKTDNPNNKAATARGGGIYTGKDSSFTMTGGKVTHNEARGGGGGVYCYQPTSFSMTDVEISYNDSESKGGGLRIRTTNSVEAQLTNCTIKNCRATETDLSRSSDGGGIYMQEGKLRMTGCTIGGADGHGNQSAFAGAGFYQHGGTTYATNCTISYNSAYTQHDRMYGGGICLYAGTYTMDGGTITENHSYRDGGGVYIRSGATFNVLGNIQINDNFRTRPGAVPEDTDNNAYLDGNAKINIVGDLDPAARIHITGHGLGGVYTSGMNAHVTCPANFVTDGKYQKLNDYQVLDEINLAPYEWYNPGAWSVTTQPQTTPSNSDSVVINRAFELEPGEIGYANKIRYVTGRIILKDGAQLICYNQATETPIEALIRKNIEKTTDDYGWYTISAPIDAVKIYDAWEQNTNLMTKTSDPYDFDLLRYHEPTHFWDSYTDNSAHNTNNAFTYTEKGRGYLYRNGKDMTISFYGNIELGNVSVNVTAKGDKLTGFNLIGNPYTHTIYKGDGTAIPNGSLLKSGFYTLTREGAWVAKTDNSDPIGVCQGILVQANNDGTITMTNSIATGSSKANTNSVRFAVANSKYEDVAYATIGKGSGLNKIEHINENIPMVYIRHNDEDYAVAVLNDATRVFNLCFQTKTIGRYTLKVNVDGEFSYLHLLDCLTGEDVDLLNENEYSFIASSIDDEDRFVVLLGDNSESDNDFAFQNGDDIIVSGNGELQIFDVAGRMVSRQMVNGLEVIRKPYRTGVYILRLKGSELKTQKIVVR